MTQLLVCFARWLWKYHLTSTGTPVKVPGLARSWDIRRGPSEDDDGFHDTDLQEVIISAEIKYSYLKSLQSEEGK